MSEDIRIESSGLEGREELHIRLFKASSIPIGNDWNGKGIRSPFWRLYLNDSDGASIETETGVCNFEGGKIYFVPAGVLFDYRNSTEIRHFYMHFDILGLPGLVIQEMFSHPVCVPAPQSFVQIVEALSHRLELRPNIDLILETRLKSVAYEALALCFEELPQERQDHFARQTAMMTEVLPAIRRIDSDLRSSLSNAVLAELCSLSENHFIRRFKERLGQTPARYIQERRVAQAAQKLLFTSDSIEKIADETGFGNRFYFTRVFAKYHSLSPAAYRKRERV